MSSIKLDPVKKKLIVGKMRSSGQCFEVLRDGDCFCALGCICDVSGVGEWEFDDISWDEGGGHKYCEESLGLPEEVMRWLGCTEMEMFLVYEGKNFHIVDLNDILKLPLPVIADLVEEQW